MKSILDHVRSGKFATATFKRSGEKLVRTMSEKAWAAYTQNDPCEVYHSTLTGEILIHSANGWDCFYDVEIAEKFLESMATWYAPIKSENDTDYHNGSYDYFEAVSMAERLDCEYLACVTADGYLFEVEEV